MELFVTENSAPLTTPPAASAEIEGRIDHARQTARNSIGAVVVLAAGTGSRLRLFTRYTPKPLVPIPGGTFLEHHLDRLVVLGLPIYVVCHYMEEKIANLLRERYLRCDVHMIHQAGELGTAADGLLAAESMIHSDFLVVHADHVFGKNPFPKLLQHHTAGNITFVVEANGPLRSLGYGQTCAVDDATGAAYPFESRRDLREEILVDGVMILPAKIFYHIRSAKAELAHPVDMKDVFQRLTRQGDIEMRVVQSEGRYANVNDLDSYCNMLKMLQEDLQPS